jgi:hypothetical protein
VLFESVDVEICKTGTVRRFVIDLFTKYYVEGVEEA